MKKGVKLILSIVILIAGLFFAILAQSVVTQSGKVSMIPGLVLVVSIVGIIAIWKKNKNSKGENNDELDKLNKN